MQIISPLSEEIMAASAAQTRLTQEYVLVSEDKVLVEHYRRQEKQETAPVTGDDWIVTDCQELEESLSLTSIQCELPLQEIYERVTFPD